MSHKVRSILIICLIGLVAPAGAAQPTRLPLYSTYEASFTVPGDEDNPYALNVWATFTAPSGREVVVPAFYMQPYEDVCGGDCQAEELEPVGESAWFLRFTPDEIGTWRYIVSTDTDPLVKSGRFDVEPAENPGFIRLGTNGRYFAFDDGTPYFPIGHNLGWSWEQGGGVYAYLEWLDRLQTAGANYARLNIDVPWFIGLEWTPPAGQYGDAGQQAAWRLDTILNAAEARGIHLQLVLIWNQAFRSYTAPPVTIPESPARPSMTQDFDNHPYNARQGGSLQGPGEILLNAVAQDWLEQRLRYIVARWGHSTSVFAWEIVDDLDRIALFSTEPGNAWLSQMANILDTYDAYDHPVTVGTQEFRNAILANDVLDFVQARFYQTRPIEPAVDQVSETLSILSESLSRIPRPVLLTEFSLNPWYEPASDDPQGVHVHNTIWAAALSGAAGSAMSWWWDTYIDRLDLYALYTPLALFTQGIPWNTLNLQSIETGLVSDTPIIYDSIRIDAFDRQFRAEITRDTILRVTADGMIPPAYLMSSYLYGTQYHTENSRPQTLIVSPPVDTTLTIGIRSVSTAADAQLVVTIDDTVAALLDLSANTDATSISIPITAGQHTVVLDNQGDDWLQLDYLEVSDYRAPLRTLALADRAEGVVLAWIHHRDYTWENIQTDTTITPLDYNLSVPDMPPGVYRVEYWDTLSGFVVGESVITQETNGNMIVPLLPVQSQLALRIFRVTER